MASSRRCFLLVCCLLAGLEAAQSAAHDNAFFPDSAPPDGTVIWYEPGTSLTFSVEVHSTESNDTFPFPLSLDLGTGGPATSNGPIVSVSRGAFIGDVEPGRPAPSVNFEYWRSTSLDPMIEIRKRFYNHEFGKIEASDGSVANIGTSFDPWPSTFKFHHENFTVDYATDGSGARFVNRTRITYKLMTPASLATDLQNIPNPMRTICIRAGMTISGNPQPRESNDGSQLRCYSIIFNVKPKASICCFGTRSLSSLLPDADQCGSRTLTPVTFDGDRCNADHFFASGIPVGMFQEVKVHTYFEDFNTDLLASCPYCDQVDIAVLSDPGVPNSASIGTTIANSSMVTGPDAPSVQVSLMLGDSGQGSQTTAVYSVSSRMITFRPDSSDLGMGADGIKYQLCFTGTSTNARMSSYYPMGHSIASRTSDQVCGFLQVLKPKPMIVSTQMVLPVANTTVLPLVVHNTDMYVTQNGADTLPLHVTVRCPYTWRIVTKDMNNDMGANLFDSEDTAGYKRGHYTGKVMEDAMNPLPPGATLSAPVTDMNTFQTTQILTWTPIRGSEGSDFTFCLNVVENVTGFVEQTVCTTLRVKKCEVCTEAGDTLVSVAREYQTDWLQLWGANPTVVTPNQLHEYTPLMLGPRFVTNRAEPLSILAARFKMDFQEFMAMNPDFHGMTQIPSGAESCTIPRICEGSTTL